MQRGTCPRGKWRIASVMHMCVRAKSGAGCCFMELIDGPLPLCQDRCDDNGSDKGVFASQMKDAVHLSDPHSIP